MSLRAHFFLRTSALTCSVLLAASLAGCTDTPLPVDAAMGNDGGDAGRDAGRDGGDAGRTDGGAAVCGDGVVAGAEACDDGDTMGGDGCSATCTAETGWTCSAASPSVCTAVCGDGMLVGAESGANGCDDGDTTAGDGCGATCMVEMGWACAGTPSVCTNFCGNGMIESPEACDDGGNADLDGCSMGCMVEAGWTCDAAEPTVCTSTCGDGTVAAGAETCDDANTDVGDGCDDTCQTETGYDCSSGTCAPICGDSMVILPETCDDGNAVTEECAYGAPSCTVCAMDCQSTAGAVHVCGDGTTDAADETCDDGNTVSETACPYGMATCSPCAGDCSAAITGLTGGICGDGNVDAPDETCDDGNTDAGDGCDATCQREAVCGDGLIDGAETCDDAGTDPGDGCDASCAVEAGYTCVGVPSFCVIATPIAAPGGTVGLAGSIDATDPTWSRRSATCGAGSAGKYYDVFYIVNETGEDQRLNLTAMWGGDGYLHVFQSPFDLTTGAGCVVGDDDFATDGSQILGVTIPAGGVLMVVASTFASGDATGPYTIDVDTTDCGDGTIDPGEVCDDGNRTTGDGCGTACTVETGFSCTGASPSVCTLNCGNGTLQSGEACDDGNTAAGDGCSPTCAFEPGFVCSGTPSTCRPIVCGDGMVEGAERCDDGNTVSGDGCSATCTVESDEIAVGTGTPVAIPDNLPATPVVTTATVTSTCTVAAVELTVAITHTWVGDVGIMLTAPGGAPIEIIPNAGVGSGNDMLGPYVFAASGGGNPAWPGAGDPVAAGRYIRASMTGLAGGSAAGTWSLTVADNGAGDSGTLQSWSIAVRCAP